MRQKSLGGIRGNRGCKIRGVRGIAWESSKNTCKKKRKTREIGVQRTVREKPGEDRANWGGGKDRTKRGQCTNRKKQTGLNSDPREREGKGT